MIFKVHRNNLQTPHSIGFAAPDHGTICDHDEKVLLSEKSSVLDLLLRYLYPEAPPDLSKVSFTDLAGLAEAAQKYGVWHAMEVSKAHMQNAIPTHGFEVLEYAAKHDFRPLADEAAEYSILAPMTLAAERLNPKYFRAFALYVDHRRFVINKLLPFHLFSHTHESDFDVTCLHWSIVVHCLQRYLRNFEGPLRLAKVLDVFLSTYYSDTTQGGEEIRPCDLCLRDMMNWRLGYAQKMPRIDKQMSTFFV